jgi:hypothetical protein
MATGPVVNQGKTVFLEEFLPENRDADEDSVNEAWRASGNEGKVSESLISKTRSRLKIPKKRSSKVREDVGSKAKKMAKPKEAKGKARAMAEEIPSQPAGQESDRGPSKSSFVEELLGRDPGANLKAVNEAWASSGHEGQISPSIYYKIKRERVGTGETSPTTSRSESVPSKAAPETSPKTPKTDKAPSLLEAASSPIHPETASSDPTPTLTHPSGGHGRELHEIEGEIDELMFRLKGLGNFADVQEALRVARRLLVRSHQH